MSTIDQLIGRQLPDGAIPFGNDAHLLFSHDPINFTWDDDTDTLHAKNITADSITVASLIGTLDVPNYTLAGLPVAGNAGRVALVTDDVGGLFVDTGSVWQSVTLDHNLLGDFHSDAPTAVMARGDLLKRNASSQWAPFNKGARGGILRADASDLSYLAIGGAGAILNTDGVDPVWLAKGARGGILRSNASDISYLALGTTGAILKSDGTDPVYLTKGARGGILRADAGDISYLAIGGAGGLLTTDGVDPSWLALAARGGILRSNASTVSFLALGTTGHYLTAGATDPEWTALPAFTPSVITTKGDLIVGNATPVAARLAVGITNDMVLAVDSGQTLGVKWMTLSAYAEKATLTTKGDIYVATAASTVARLGAGSNGTVLKADSTQTEGLRFGLIEPNFGSIGNTSTNNSGTPDTQMDLIAQYVWLRNPTTGDVVMKASPGTLTNNVLTAGSAAGGRDQAGTFGTSVWIYFYWIWNGTTLSTLSSLTAPPTGPTLPSGYTHWAYATACYYTSAPVLKRIITRGNRIIYDHPNSSQRAIADGVATTLTALSLATFAPPVNDGVVASVLLQYIHSAIALITVFYRPTGSAITGVSITSAPLQVAAGTASGQSIVTLTTGTSTQIDYKLDSAPNSGGGLYLDITGYLIPNGGV